MAAIQTTGPKVMSTAVTVIASREQLSKLTPCLLALLQVPDPTSILSRWEFNISQPHFIRAFSPNLDLAIERSWREEESATDPVRATFLFKGALWNPKQIQKSIQEQLQPYLEDDKRIGIDPWKPSFWTHYVEHTKAIALTTSVALFTLNYFSFGMALGTSVIYSAIALLAVQFFVRLALESFVVKVGASHSVDCVGVDLNGDIASIEDKPLHVISAEYKQADHRLAEGKHRYYNVPASELRDVHNPCGVRWVSQSPQN